MGSKARELGGVETAALMVSACSAKSISEVPIEPLSKLVRHAKPDDLPADSREKVELFLLKMTSLLLSQACSKCVRL